MDARIVLDYGLTSCVSRERIPRLYGLGEKRCRWQVSGMPLGTANRELEGLIMVDVVQRESLTWKKANS